MNRPPLTPKELTLQLANERANVAVLVEALKRQAENMAFVLNNCSLTDSWYGKLTDELAQDRAALSSVEGGR